MPWLSGGSRVPVGNALTGCSSWASATSISSCASTSITTTDSVLTEAWGSRSLLLIQSARGTDPSSAFNVSAASSTSTHVWRHSRARRLTAAQNCRHRLLRQGLGGQTHLDPTRYQCCGNSAPVLADHRPRRCLLVGPEPPLASRRVTSPQAENP